MTRDRRPAATTLLRRLSLRLALVMGFAFLAQTTLVAWEYGRDREDLARNAMSRETDLIVAAMSEKPDGLHVDLPPEVRRRYATYPEAYGFAVIDIDGKVRASRNAELFAGTHFDPEADLDMTWNVDDFGNGTRRVSSRLLENRTPPMTVRVVFVDDPAKVWIGVLLAELGDHVAGPLTPITVLVLAVVLWVVRRSLAPLEKAAAAAAEVDPRTASFRLADTIAGRDPPAEVVRFAEVLDKLFERIEAVTQAQAAFAGSIAHELRTPLSLLALELDGVEGPAAERARADVQAMARAVEQLLGIARLDALSFDPADRIDPTAIAADVVGRLAPLAIAAGRDLALVYDDGQRFPGNADAVTGALRNLVENALRVTPPGGTVTVTSGPGPTIMVEDEGPGLPPGGAAPLFARFVQGDRAVSGSAGLGLAIVAKTMEVHGGRIEAGDRPQGGAYFTLDFRRAGPAEPAGAA